MDVKKESLHALTVSPNGSFFIPDAAIIDADVGELSNLTEMLRAKAVELKMDLWITYSVLRHGVLVEWKQEAGV